MRPGTLQIIVSFLKNGLRFIVLQSHPSKVESDFRFGVGTSSKILTAAQLQRDNPKQLLATSLGFALRREMALNAGRYSCGDRPANKCSSCYIQRVMVNKSEKLVGLSQENSLIQNYLKRLSLGNADNAKKSTK